MIEGTRRAYDEWHAANAGSGMAALSSWHENALQLAPEIADAALLEAGCGDGVFSIELAKRGGRVTAFDFSQTAVDAARRRAETEGVAASIQFSVADLHRIPFPAAAFDLVFCCECLEHVGRPGVVLAELRRVLKPGGRLVLTTENYTNAMLVYWLMAWVRGKPFNSGVHPQPVEHFFVYPMILRMLRGAGLRPGRMAGSHHVFLAVPGMHPQRFVIERFHTKIAARFFRPLARHMAYEAFKTA
jgi:ubiquinone/menaquinone biosynthesis C-methylase UbiE